MPATPRTRICRSLSPSLLPITPHRYLPYHRINSSFSFGESATSTSRSSASDASSVSSQDSCTCDRLDRLNLSDRSVSPEQKPRLPSIASMVSRRAMPHMHRRAISLSSAPSGYVVFPSPARSRPTPPTHPTMSAQPIPSIRRVHPPAPRAHNQHQRRPMPIRIPSPPLTPIEESPRPMSKFDEKLLLVTPGVAACLRQGGSVSVKGPDGKSWKIRAPVRPPPSSVMMMRMQ